MRRQEPPRWLERALVLFLNARDRESVSGDLLEEYREERLPNGGSVPANIWYLRQVIGFAAARISKGPKMKRVLASVCLFVLAAGVWLAVMEGILKHNGYSSRIFVDGCIVVQSLATLVFLFIPEFLALRSVIMTGAAALAVLGGWAALSVIRGPHFEGYVLVIGSGLILQGVLTIATLVRIPSGSAA